MNDSTRLTYANCRIKELEAQLESSRNKESEIRDSKDRLTTWLWKRLFGLYKGSGGLLKFDEFVERESRYYRRPNKQNDIW